MINKIPVLVGNTTTGNFLYDRIAYDEVLRRMALGSERIWFARDAAQIPPSNELFFAFKKRASQVNGFPIVVHSQQQMLGRESEDDHQSFQQALQQEHVALIESAPLAENIPVKLRKYNPDELSFEVNCPADGRLLVTDRWARSPDFSLATQ